MGVSWTASTVRPELAVGTALPPTTTCHITNNINNTSSNNNNISNNNNNNRQLRSASDTPNTSLTKAAWMASHR